MIIDHIGLAVSNYQSSKVFFFVAALAAGATSLNPDYRP